MPTTDQETSLDLLRAACERGGVIHTVVRHTSKSGMQRAIQVLITEGSEIINISGLVAEAGLFPLHAAHPGLKVRGCGMDMAAHVVHSLSQALYGRPYALTHRAL